MAIVCPNYNDPRWVVLEKEYGNVQAHKIWEENGNDFPEMSIIDIEDVIMNDGASQEEITLAIRNTQKEISDEKKVIYKTIDGVQVPFERYTDINGNIIENRVTDVQDEIFRRNKSVKQALEINNRPDNVIKRETGTRMHEVLEQIFNDFKAGREPSNKTKDLSDKLFNRLNDGATELYNHIKETQNKINPNGKFTLLTENKVWDKEKDIAGSIDLLVVFSDGSVAVYDYKFINFYKEKREGVVGGDDLINMKEESWGLQASEYKRILQEVYGVDIVRETRVIPVDTQFKKKKVGDKYEITPEVTDLQMLIEGREHLQPVPLANELTNSKKLNALLGEFYKLKAAYRDATKSAPTPAKVEFYKARYKNITKAIRDIQVKQDFTHVINEASDVIKFVNKNINIEDTKNPKYLSTGELKEYKDSLVAYKHLLKVSDLIKKSRKGLDKEAAELARDKFAEANTAIDVMIQNIQETMRLRLISMAREEGVKNLTELQSETTWFGNQIKYRTDFTMPAFQLLNKKIDGIIDKTRTDVNNLNDTLKELHNKLVEFGEANGKSGLDVFEYIIDADNGLLVDEFSAEFNDSLDKARDSKNLKWLKENLEWTESDKEVYRERRKKQKEYIDRFNSGKSEKYRDQQLKLWERRNNPKYEDAWYNPYVKLSVKNPTKHQSEKYKFIMQNEALKNYYEFYKEMNLKFREMLPKSAGIHETFIPWIQRDMIDAIAENGIFAFRTLGNSIADSLEVKQDDPTFGMRGDNENKQIPILFTRPIIDKNGNPDVTRKSLDLSRSLILFGQMAYNYKHTAEVEDSINSLRELVVTQDQIVTDKFGKPVMDQITKLLKAGTGDEQTLKAFDSLIDFYVYGRKRQGKDFLIKVGEKDISGSKILKAAMEYFSIKTIGLSPVAAAGAYIGATANMYMTGVKNTHYSNKNINKAQKLLVQRDEKAIALYKFFEVSQNDLTYKKANDLSASKLARTFTVDHAFKPLEMADDSVDYNITVAMMMNYGLDPSTGKARRLSLLPEGTKSLWDLSEIKDGKPHVKGMTETGYNDFRRKVMYVASTVKGNYSKEDIMIANTKLAGQALLQFKNWLPRLFAERFRSGRYNEFVEEVEIGRYRVFAGEVLRKGFLPKIGAFVEMLLEVGSFGVLYKMNADEAQTKRYYEAFKIKNPNFKGTLEEYKQARMSQLRAMAAEIRMYLIVIGAWAVLSSDWDDDGEKLYQEIPGGKQLLRVVNKARMEIGVFMRPSEAKYLLSRPLPIIGLLYDLEGLISNSFDETRDFIMMDDYKGVISWKKDPNDKTPAMKYTSKFIPFWNPMSNFFDYFEDKKEDK